MKFVNKNYLPSECKVKTVFDSYPQEPPTKDSTHLHSAQRSCTNIRIANNTVLDLTKLRFLSNSDNKQSFVDNLALKLANITGIENVKARHDADCHQKTVDKNFAQNCLKRIMSQLLEFLSDTKESTEENWHMSLKT